MVFGLILRFAETRRVAVTWRRREFKRSSKIAPTIFNDFLDTKKYNYSFTYNWLLRIGSENTARIFRDRGDISF